MNHLIVCRSFILSNISMEKYTPLALKKGWGMKKLKQKMYETGFKKLTKQYKSLGQECFEYRFRMLTLGSG